MDLRKTGVLVILAVLFPSTEAAIGLNDPMLCYILDGVLLLYGLIVTALFFREKYFKPKEVTSKEDGIYMGLNQTPDTYDQLRLPRDAESGGTATRKTRKQTDETYTALQRPAEDDYKEIGVKKERRRNKNEQLYQGLSPANKATYDSLQMQQLPPR